MQQRFSNLGTQSGVRSGSGRGQHPKPRRGYQRFSAPSGANSRKSRWYRGRASPGMRDEHGPLPHLPPALSGAVPQLLAPHPAPLPLPQLRRQRLLLLSQQPLQALPPPLQPRRRLLRVPPDRSRAAAHTGSQRDPGTAPRPAGPRPYLGGGTRGSLHFAWREQEAAARAKARLVLSHCCRLRASCSRRSATLRASSSRRSAALRPHHIHSDIAARPQRRLPPRDRARRARRARREAGTGGGRRGEAGREMERRRGWVRCDPAVPSARRCAGPLCRLVARSTAGFVAL